MRRVGAELGTGAGSLYRYVQNRDELLELMSDHVAGEYSLDNEPGDWLADLVDLGLQAREIHRRHPWLPDLVMTSPGVGPRTVDVLEHYLSVVAPISADDSTKLTAFAVLNALVASIARNEQAGAALQRNAEYLTHVAVAGTHPRISALRVSDRGPQDPLPDILRAVLRGFFETGSSA